MSLQVARVCIPKVGLSSPNQLKEFVLYLMVDSEEHMLEILKAMRAAQDDLMQQLQYDPSLGNRLRILESLRKSFVDFFNMAERILRIEQPTIYNDNRSVVIHGKDFSSLMSLSPLQRDQLRRRVQGTILASRNGTPS
jgi:hypothetical protein